MYRKTAALSALALVVAIAAGCDQKDNKKVVTHYSTDKCFVDTIAGKGDATVYVAPGTVEISGWAVDASNQTSPKEVRLRLTGLQGSPHTFENPSRFDRPDIVKAFNNDQLKNSGFLFRADLSSLAPGGYGIIVEIPDGNALIVCQPKKALVVK